MKIARIVIENIHNISTSLRFEPGFNYLYGKNGAGKSTMLQSIQLALLGYIPGYNKRNSDIFKHATGNPMSVKIEFDNGASIKRIYTQTSKTIDVQVITTPENLDIPGLVKDIELPVFNFNDLVGMTANQLKAWFINLLPKGYTNIDWKQELKQTIPDGVEDYEDITSNILKYIDGLSEEADVIAEVNAYVKQLISNKKAEINRIVATLQTLVHFDDFEITRPVSDIQAEYESVCNTRSELEKYIKNKSRIDQIQKTIAEGCADVVEHGYEDSKIYVDKLQRMLDDKRKSTQDMHSRLHDLKFDQQQLSMRLSELKNTNGVCPVTGIGCVHLSSDSGVVSETEAKLTGLSADIDVLQHNYDVASKEIEDWSSILYSYSDQIGMYERLTSELKSLEVRTFDDTETVESYLSRESALLDELKKSTANAQYDSMYEQLTSQQAVCETSLDILKRFDKLTGANGLSTRIMSDAFNEFGQTIESYLSAVYGKTEVQFVLTDAANSFSFGINRDGIYISYDMLSSGEKCLFALSLIFAILDVINPDIKLITADDIFDHLDDDNIDKLFKYVYNNKGVQTVFAGIHSYPRKYQNAVIEV